jgi:CheY-like chemotaxis protein
MNAILGLNGVLKDQLMDAKDDLARGHLIRESTQHLLAVVNDILDFSQLQAQRMVLGVQPVALHELALEMHSTLKSKVVDRHIQTPFACDAQLPAWVMSDGKRLQQIITNLLDNAVKFTTEGHISLRFSSCALGLRVEVEDTGIGMSDEQQAQIFGGFEKSNQQAYKIYGGTGLGLSICEKLIHLQGGRIGVSSQVNQGSLFWFELPLTKTTPPAFLAAPTTLSVAPAQMLIVDDHPVNLLVAQRMAQKIWPQLRVHTANTGAGALDFLQTQTVDIVLMDMFMPDMDGVQVSKAIRQLPSPHNRTPILGLTASSNSFDHQQCLDAGMNDIVFKPLEKQSLEQGVWRCLREQQRADS